MFTRGYSQPGRDLGRLKMYKMDGARLDEFADFPSRSRAIAENGNMST